MHQTIICSLLSDIHKTRYAVWGVSVNRVCCITEYRIIRSLSYFLSLSKTWGSYSSLTRWGPDISIQAQTCLNVFRLEHLIAAVLARAVKYMCMVSEDLQVRISKRAQNIGGRYIQHFRRDHGSSPDFR